MRVLGKKQEREEEEELGLPQNSSQNREVENMDTWLSQDSLTDFKLAGLLRTVLLSNLNPKDKAPPSTHPSL